MKKIAIIFFTFLAICVNAQEKKRTVQEVKSASIEKDVEPKTLHSENKPIYVSTGTNSIQPIKTVEYYDNLINAVYAKINYIKSNEEESKKAEESGWFVRMNELLLEAKQEKKKLQNSIK